MSALFAELDRDGNGKIEYKELYFRIRSANVAGPPAEPRPMPDAAEAAAYARELEERRAKLSPLQEEEPHV